MRTADQRLYVSVLIVLFTFHFSTGYSQSLKNEVDSLYSELDSLFAEEHIPSDLLTLVDSLIALDTARISSLNVRLGYVSNIVSAGRSFGFEKYGLTPGITFYHHSGLFGGFTGYWNSEDEPHYYMTNLSVGYLYQKLKSWTFVVNHDFYLYNDSLPKHSFDKSAQASVYYQYKKVNINLDYAYLYGEETAHRITLSPNARIKMKTHGLIQSITLLPGASFMWGNSNVYYLRQPRTALNDLYGIVKANDFPKLNLRNYVKLVYYLEQNRMFLARNLLHQRDYTDAQITKLMDAYYAGQVHGQNTFGFMNYNFSIPIILRTGPFSLTLNYTYNIPVSLPGESYHYDANGFFSATLSYNVFFIKGSKK
jgi:hypothetical protein